MHSRIASSTEHRTHLDATPLARPAAPAALLGGLSVDCGRSGAGLKPAMEGMALLLVCCWPTPVHAVRWRRDGVGVGVVLCESMDAPARCLQRPTQAGLALYLFGRRHDKRGETKTADQRPQIAAPAPALPLPTAPPTPTPTMQAAACVAFEDG